MSETMPIAETEFWESLIHDVFGPRSGGAVLLVDAENARKGIGKTSAAVAIGRLAARAFDYELAEEDLVLAGDRYLDRLREHPDTEQPSVVVWDEAVGAGSGDARRSMAEQNRVMGQAWQLLRTKRIVSLVTLPDWNELDKRLRKLADYRLWCRERPIGTLQAYKIETPFEGSGLQTRGLGPGEGAQPIEFPNLDAAGCPYYEYVTEKKDELIHADTFDADVALADGGGDQRDPEEAAADAERTAQVKTALRAVKPWDDHEGMTHREAAKLTDYSHSWVTERVNEWHDGLHRDLVEEGEVLTA